MKAQPTTPTVEAAKFENLKCFQNFITKTTCAALCVESIDKIISNYIYLMGNAENKLYADEYSDDLFHLRQLKSLFIITAVENGEDIMQTLLENAKTMM